MSVNDFLQHFGLTTMPFARAVPQDGLVQHKSFVEARTRLQLAFESRTPALFCAEAGLGKSTLLGALADSLDKTTTRITYTQLCACGPYARSTKLEILVLDDAHRLPTESLDELRLLSNLDFDRTAPFSLLLVGQPPLRKRLEEPEIFSLNQRIGLRASLAPLSAHDNADYIERRLRAVGATASIIQPAAIDKIFERGCGVPRQINNLASAAMLSAFASGKKHVDTNDVENAIFDHENF